MKIMDWYYIEDLDVGLVDVWDEWHKCKDKARRERGYAYWLGMP
jgi:hypothetical protein